MKTGSEWWTNDIIRVRLGDSPRPRTAMPRGSAVISTYATLLAVVAPLLLIGAEPQRRPDTSARTSGEDALAAFLQDYAREPRIPEDRTTKYSAAFIDLNGDSKNEVIVYITGQSWCGSGGCTMLVLAEKDSSYTVVTKVTIAQLPIRVLTGRSHGWHNLGVWVEGGGIQVGYEAELRFDGRTYPRNPTVPPAIRLSSKVPGTVVIASAEHAQPLYRGHWKYRDRRN